MSEYKISFWNYERTGVWDEARAVRDWKEAGINLAMTFELSETEDKSRMIKLLDECEKANIKAIVCDERTTYYALNEKGEEKFRELRRCGVWLASGGLRLSRWRRTR